MRWVMSGGTEPPIRGHWLEVWIGKTPRANPGHKGSIVAGMVLGTRKILPKNRLKILCDIEVFQE